MRPFLLTLLLAALPLLFGFWVNTTAPPPACAYAPARCTRYCAAHACRHATRRVNSPAYFRLQPVYAANVRGLLLGGRARYAAVNVAFYLVLVPGLLLWLTYGALRNAGRLRHLKRQLA